MKSIPEAIIVSKLEIQMSICSQVKFHRLTIGLMNVLKES